MLYHFNWSLRVAMWMICVIEFHNFISLTISLLNSYSLGVTWKLGVIWGNLHYLRLIDQSKMTDKNLQFVNIYVSLVNKLNVFPFERIHL